jgi:Putative restriction endonuclease
MGEVLDRRRAPARRQIDVGAYYKMAEAGILTESDRVELIGGEIFDMAPIGSTHAGKTDRLNHLFARAAADGLALIELSESSLAYDRGIKLALYARFGVPEVWIVDLPGAAIEVYREPAGDAYAVKQRLTSGSLAPVLAPGVTIDIGALLA